MPAQVRLLDAGVVRPGAVVVVTTARPCSHIRGSALTARCATALRRSTSPAVPAARRPVRRRRTGLVVAVTVTPLVLAGSSFLLGLHGVGSVLLGRLVGLLCAVALLAGGVAGVAGRSTGAHCPGCPD